MCVCAHPHTLSATTGVPLSSCWCIFGSQVAVRQSILSAIFGKWLPASENAARSTYVCQRGVERCARLAYSATHPCICKCGFGWWRQWHGNLHKLQPSNKRANNVNAKSGPKRAKARQSLAIALTDTTRTMERRKRHKHTAHTHTHANSKWQLVVVVVIVVVAATDYLVALLLLLALLCATAVFVACCCCCCYILFSTFPLDVGALPKSQKHSLQTAYFCCCCCCACIQWVHIPLH